MKPALKSALAPAVNAAARHRPSRARAEKDPYDWYVEEPHAVHCLLDVLEELGCRPTGVLDPFAGMGTIPAACRERGIPARGSDVADRGCADVAGGIDFLGIPPYAPGSADWIVTNPPYYSGRGPVAALVPALRTARIGVAFLVNLPFLCSQGRHPFFHRHRPSDIVILSMRPSMPPGALLAARAVKQTSGKEDYCWIVWRHDAGRTGTVTHWRLPRPEHRPRTPASRARFSPSGG